MITLFQMLSFWFGHNCQREKTRGVINEKDNDKCKNNGFYVRFAMLLEEMA